MLISDMPESVIPDDFQPGRHAVYCKPDLSDLAALVRRYLDDEPARAAIAAAGREHVLRHHTCERRAEYFLDACRKWA
jgi:spore maturation protein CgeB